MENATIFIVGLLIFLTIAGLAMFGVYFVEDRLFRKNNKKLNQLAETDRPRLLRIKFLMNDLVAMGLSQSEALELALKLERLGWRKNTLDGVEDLAL